MNEKSNHDSLGVPSGEDSFSLDDAATAALKSLQVSLEASRNVTKNVVGTSQDLTKITLDLTKGLTDKTQKYVKRLGQSIIGLVRDDEPALGDHHKED